MSAPALPAWTYLPPTVPEDHDHQRWYRRGTLNPAGHYSCRVDVYRSGGDTAAQINIAHHTGKGDFRCSVTLGVASLLVLRDAISDALTDIAAREALQVGQQAGCAAEAAP